MRTQSPLLVDVFELLEAPGSRKRLQFSAPVAGLDTDLAHATGDLTFDLTLEAIEGGIFVSGEISGTFVAECRRCLASVEGSFSEAAGELFRPAADAWDDGYSYRDTTVDLGPLVLDTVVLTLPVNPLCRPDCLGLCPKCGANRNDGDCDCPTEDGDPRWSALKALAADLGPDPEAPLG